MNQLSNSIQSVPGLPTQHGYSILSKPGLHAREHVTQKLERKLVHSGDVTCTLCFLSVILLVKFMYKKQVKVVSSRTETWSSVSCYMYKEQKLGHLFPEMICARDKSNR